MYDDDELEEEEGGSRLFVILSIALIGLLVLGLLGIGGVFVIRQNLEQQAVAGNPSPTVLIRLPPPSPTFTPSPIATNTPAPTPTNTPVVAPGANNAEEAAAASGRDGGLEERAGENQGQGSDENGADPTPRPSPTRTPVPGGEKAGAGEVPNTGLGVFETVLIAAGLIVVFFVARRMRTA